MNATVHDANPALERAYPGEAGAPKPLFVLGMHRSGTTWLANQLCEHPRISGICHARHHGIHESAYFSRVYGRYGDLGIRANFDEFVEVVGASDYFRLAGVEKAELRAWWPATYESVFRRVMDAYAARRGAEYWLEKSPPHTLQVAWLAGRFPDARFVAIQRELIDVVASATRLAARRAPGGRLGRRTRTLLIALTARSWAWYNRVIQDFAATSPRIRIVRYDAMRHDLKAAVEPVFAFLGLPFDERVCRSRFAPNTSFRSEYERCRTLSAPELALARFAAYAAGALPGPLIQRLATTRRRFGRRTPLPPWFFAPESTARAVDGGDSRGAGVEDVSQLPR